MGAGSKIIFGAVILGVVALIYLLTIKDLTYQEYNDQDLIAGEIESGQANEVPEESAVITTIPEDIETPERESEQDQHAISNEAVYTVRMRSSWTKQLQPNFYPNGPHLSPMIAWSHREKDTLYHSGGIASEGMEIMAETGAPAVITEEIKALIATGDIFGYGVGKVFFTPGEESIQVQVSKNAPYITVVSMIAPSPDWFISVRNVNLYENDKWLEQLSLPAALYDAGTDNGTDFAGFGKDDDTNPKEPIGRFEGAPSNPIATFDFIRN